MACSSPSSPLSMRWPEPGPHLGPQLAPLGLARQLQRAVAARLRAFVARRHQRQRLAAVLELQVRRQPDAVAQVLGRIELDVREPRVGNPVVAAVDEGLEHRAEAHVGIGEPFEGLAVERARRGGRGVEGAAAQVLGQRRVAACPGAAATRSGARAIRRAGRRPSACACRRTRRRAGPRSGWPRRRPASSARRAHRARPPR